MAILRKATAVWHGNLREGNGQLTTDSKTLNSTPYAFTSRFEEGQGTNPEELLAAAHAGCYSMALASGLSRKEFVVHHVSTEATVYLTPQETGGSKITRIHLVTRGKVEAITPEVFEENAAATAKNCIVSQALSAVEITHEAHLE